MGLLFIHYFFDILYLCGLDGYLQFDANDYVYGSLPDSPFAELLQAHGAVYSLIAFELLFYMGLFTPGLDYGYERWSVYRYLSHYADGIF